MGAADKPSSCHRPILSSCPHLARTTAYRISSLIFCCLACCIGVNCLLKREAWTKICTVGNCF
ncbi:hypothetical protein CDEST_02531 [Colletotrichum destructivum]|uniref:Uncharacterized protein n=1 Tax=Colletotrichum destructivum TaxID=34406 RepID=A0AAX4I2B6_9PEZI|nr:hypothetical protein CDEST_02531 [Colletotrichum destructivum]